jgi:hypothetical protein
MNLNRYSNIPEYISDDYLQEMITYINKIYINIIDIIDISNYKELDTKIQELSESILDEINMIIYCKDKNKYLLDTIIIIYNQSYQLYLDKKHLFASISK